MSQLQAQSEQPSSPTDEQIAFARALIDEALAPALRDQITKLNAVLSKKGIHAGVELTWMFQRTDVFEDTGSKNHTTE